MSKAVVTSENQVLSRTSMRSSDQAPRQLGRRLVQKLQPRADRARTSIVAPVKVTSITANYAGFVDCVPFLLDCPDIEICLKENNKGDSLVPAGTHDPPCATDYRTDCGLWALSPAFSNRRRRPCGSEHASASTAGG
jgi:hypothetical protein